MLPFLRAAASGNHSTFSPVLSSGSGEMCLEGGHPRRARLSQKSHVKDTSFAEVFSSLPPRLLDVSWLQLCAQRGEERLRSALISG